MFTARGWLLGWLAAAPWLCHGAEGDAPKSGEWANRLRVGAMLGFNIEADFTFGGSGITAGNPAGPTGVPGVNHFYEDGSVLVDATGNAQGYTSYFSYNDAAQYNAGAQRLTYHSTAAYTAAAAKDSASDDPHLGFEVSYSHDLFRWETVSVGLGLGIGMMPMEISGSQSLGANLLRNVHQFDTAGIVVPGAPYTGSSSGLGPTIRDTAIAQPNELTAGTVQEKLTLDADLYNIWLGPVVHWNLNRRLALDVSGGFAMGLVSGDLEFKDRIAGREVGSDSFDNDETVYGGYAGAVLYLHGEELDVPLDLYLGLQYRFLGDVSFGGGTREADLDLSKGFYITTGINWSF